MTVTKEDSTLKTQLFPLKGNQPNTLNLNKRVISYWIDNQFFDLPVVNKKAQSSTDFYELVRGLKHSNLLIDQNKVKSRLFVFLCEHRAKYIHDEFPELPKSVKTDSYLLAIPFEPILNTSGKLLFKLDDDLHSNSVVNLAALRHIFNYGLVEKSKSLTEWIDDHKTSICGHISQAMKMDEDGQKGFTPQELVTKLSKLNSELFNVFFPSEKAQEHMRSLTVHTGILEEDGKQLDWKAFYGYRGTEHSQLGPFYAKDLQTCLEGLDDPDIGVSNPLMQLLQGADSPTFLPISDITGAEQIYNSIPRILPLGCWPSNPEHGLSTLQNLAVRIVLSRESDGSIMNPIVAVNGPPGTGKTTMLKEVIADRFIRRTYNLAMKSADSFEKGLNNIDDFYAEIMSYSMVVASSNNTAVENISKELPQLKEIDALFNDIKHFKSVAPETNWGVFSAVLGNSSNRTAFVGVLQALKNHLQSNDLFYLNELSKRLSDLNESSDNIDKLIDAEVYTWMKTLDEEYIEHQGGEVSKLDILRAEYKSDYQSAFYNYDYYVEGYSVDLDCYGTYHEPKIITDYSFMTYMVCDCSSDFVENFLSKIVTLQEITIDFEQDLILKSWHCEKKDFQHLIQEYFAYKKKYNSEKFDFSCSHDNDFLSREEHAKNFITETHLPLEVNKLRAKLFTTALALNELSVLVSKKRVVESLDHAMALMGNGKDELKEDELKEAWATVFMFFPVVSSTLASVERQFDSLGVESIGLTMIDESGQAIKSNAAGIINRSKQVLVVGDPIQVEPVVTIDSKLDENIARAYLIADEIDVFKVSSGSTQNLADRASKYYSEIGTRKVGVPLLVHRRCSDPMFTLANKVAYEGLMINAQVTDVKKYLPSSWIDSSAALKTSQTSIKKYNNTIEADMAMQMLELLVKHSEKIAHEGVYIISPFKDMVFTLQNTFKALANTSANQWLQHVLSEQDRMKFKAGDVVKAFNNFAKNNIGTIHTFQGKEAGTVIMCMSACSEANTTGGASWVNSKPNMLNVALTRAKKQFFFIGAVKDWRLGRFTKYCCDIDKLIAQKKSMRDFVLECKNLGLIDSHSLLDPFQNKSFKQIQSDAVDLFEYDSEIVNPLSSETHINQEIQSDDLALVNQLLVWLSSKWSVLEYLGPPLQFADWICRKANKQITSKEKIDAQIDVTAGLIEHDDSASISTKRNLNAEEVNKAKMISSHQVNIKVFGAVWQAASIRKICDDIEMDSNVFDSYFEITKILKLQQSEGMVKAKLEIKSNIDFAEIVSTVENTTETGYYYEEASKTVQTIEQAQAAFNGFDLNSHWHSFTIMLELKYE